MTPRLSARVVRWLGGFAAVVVALTAGIGSAWAQTPVPMLTSSPYTETFADIANWTNNFASGIGANRYGSVGINGASGIPNGTTTTTSSATFVTGTAGGLQKGTGNIILLSTGASDNTSAGAFDLYLDFAGTAAGTLSFDWAEVNNSTGDRKSSLKVYASTDGTTWTELAAAAVLNVTNNVASSGSITAVALPAGFTGSSTARIRFYEYNATGGTTGSRAKIAIDNVSVTATPAPPSAPTATAATGVTSSGFTANWGAVSGATSYRLDVATDAGFTSLVAGYSDLTVAGTSQAVTGLAASTPYFYQVRAVNGAGTSGNSNTITMTTAGPLAGEPTVAASGVGFSAVGGTSMTVSWTNGDGATRMVVAKATSAVAGTPSDGSSYAANSVFGSGATIAANEYVVFNGSGNSVSVTGLAPSTTYHFAVFELNGSGGTENYLTTTPGIGNQATTLASYTWTASGSAPWTTAGSWTPSRDTPSASDILQFSGGGSVTATAVPTQTIGQLLVSGGTTVALQAGAASNVLTVGGGSGTDLSVDAGTALNIDGANALKILVATGATGTVGGTMTFTNAAHTLDAADASGVTFQSGASLTQGTGESGNVFTAAGTANAIVFASGSTFNQAAGSNPFGLGQPASKVVFQGGSLFSIQANIGPAMSGRSYANFEVNASTFSQSTSGASTLSMDNLTVTAGSLTMGMTGPFNLKGNVSVASGGTLNFTPASAATVTLNGTSVQTVSGAGTLTIGANENFSVTNTAGVQLQRSVTSLGDISVTGGALTVSTGPLSLHSMTVASSGSLTVASGQTLAVSGNLGVTGTYTGTGSTLTFTGNGSWSASPGGQDFGSVTVQSNTRTLSSSVLLSGDLTVATGATLSVSGSPTLELQRNMTLVGTGSFTSGSSTARFTTSSAATLTTGTLGNLHAMVVDKGAGSLTLLSDASGGDPIAVSTGTLDVSNHLLSGGALTVASGATLHTGIGGSVGLGGAFACDGDFTGGGQGTFLSFSAPSNTISTTNPAQDFGELTLLTGATLNLLTDVRFAEVHVNTADLNLSGHILTCGRDVITNPTGTIHVPSGSTLSVGRNLTAYFYTAGGALTFAGTGNWVNPSGTQNFGDVTISPGVTVTTGSTLNATSLTLDGALDPVSQSLIVSGNTDLNAGGSVSLAASGLLRTGSLRAFGGTVTGSAGTVELTGTPGTLGGTSALSLGRLTINPAASATMAGDVSVTSLLTLTGGNITTGSNTLAVVFPATVSRTSGGVEGNLRKHFVGGPTPSVTYELASGSGYEPVTVVPNNVTTSGEVTLSLSGALHSQIAGAGLASGRRWGHTVSLAPGAMVVSGTTQLDFTLDPAALEGSASPTTFLARAYNGGNWAQTTRLSATPTSHSAELTLGSGTTDFALGNAGIDHYIVSAASPQTQGATFTTSVAAEDQFNQPVSDDNSTAVTMGSSGAVEYDANGDATFNDNVKTLTAGALTIDTRDNTAETVNLTASDGNGKTGSRTGLVVLEPLAITTLSLPGATAGVAYSQTVAATGGTSPYTFSIDSGSLPAGLAITPGTGEISGTANTAGTDNFVVKVTDAASGTATRALSVTVVHAAPALLAFDVQPSNAAAGATIAPAVKVKVTDAFNNPIPTELVSLSLVGSGTLSGYAPTATDGSGIATFATLSVDLAGSKQLSATTTSLGPVLSTSFDITAGSATTVAFDVQPSNAAAGATIAPAVKVKVTDAFNNPIPTELVSLSLVGSGALSGYAPTATDGSGIATFSTLSVGLAGSKQLSASTTGAGPTLSTSFDITAGTATTLAFDVQPSNTLVNATISPAVQVKVTDAFNNPIATELVSLSLVGTGTLSGYAPTATDGSGIATFSALNVDQSGSKQLSAITTSLGPVLSDPFSITCPAITLSPAILPDGTTGTGYSQTVTASGGVSPYGFAVTTGSLPGGLTLAGSGLLSGSPSASGTFNFTVTATDAAGCQGTSAYTLEIQVACPAIAVLPASLPSGSIGVAYNQTLTASAGTGPFSFAVTVGSLPAGLSLSPAGVLSGTPTTAGAPSFTVGVTDANACTGSTAYTLTILAIPAAVTNLASVQQLTGNDNDGTTKIAITFTLPPGAATAEVYRAGFGHYPKYDDGGGSVPTTPSYPPASPWVLTAVTASGETDEPAGRDAYHYVVFAKNAGGGVSAVSNKTAGTLNYHLGDVSDGMTPGQGNNAVSLEDISLLGANYGIGEPDITTRGVAYLDVGPTIDLSPTSRPSVDARVDFEDLIVDALNYQVVSQPGLVAASAQKIAGPEEFRVVGPSLVEAGATVTAELWLKGGGRVQGFSATLTWDATVVAPLGMESAQWVEGQGGVVLSPRPGVVDAALLGARAQGMTGEGRVALVRFRVLRTGSSGFGLGQVVARDAENRALGDGEVVARAQEERPERTLLMSPRPNPMRSGERSALEFSLAGHGMVELAIYGVDGRRVRTVVHAEREAGIYREVWDGRDDGGRVVGSGVYYAHLVAGGTRFTQRLIYLR